VLGHENPFAQDKEIGAKEKTFPRLRTLRVKDFAESLSKPLIFEVFAG